MLVVQILLALVLFTSLLFVLGRRASRRRVEDSAGVAEQRAARRGVRRHVRPVRRPEPGPVPARRPIQAVAADLRRLSRQLALVPSGSTFVRWKALWVAYDAVLLEAAEMLDVPTDLAGQPSAGVVRDVERIRLLAALESAGLVVRA